MKFAIDVKFLLETDIALSNFDEHFVEVMKLKFGEEVEVACTFGSGQYVVILKDKI